MPDSLSEDFEADLDDELDAELGLDSLEDILDDLEGLDDGEDGDLETLAEGQTIEITGEDILRFIMMAQMAFEDLNKRLEQVEMWVLSRQQETRSQTPKMVIPGKR